MSSFKTSHIAYLNREQPRQLLGVFSALAGFFLMQATNQPTTAILGLTFSSGGAGLLLFLFGLYLMFRE